MHKGVGLAEVAQVLTGLQPPLDIGRGRGGGAGLPHAAGAHDVGQGELRPRQPGAPPQSRVERAQDGGPLLGPALRQLEERRVHPAVRQRGGGRVAGPRAQEAEQEARHVPLPLHRAHGLHAQLHLRLRHCGGRETGGEEGGKRRGEERTNDGGEKRKSREIK